MTFLLIMFRGHCYLIPLKTITPKLIAYNFEKNVSIWANDATRWNKKSKVSFKTFVFSLSSYARTTANIWRLIIWNRCYSWPVRAKSLVDISLFLDKYSIALRKRLFNQSSALILLALYYGWVVSSPLVDKNHLRD